VSLDDDRAHELIQESRNEERRARLTLEDLRHDGPPVRLRDLCSVTGFSKMKFFDAIDRGELEARAIRTGRTTLTIVERSEAVRYLEQIGFVA
jgi:hypothetical protein